MCLHKRLRKPAVLLCFFLALQLFLSPVTVIGSASPGLFNIAAAAYTVDKAQTDGTFVNCASYPEFSDARADMVSRGAAEKKLLDQKSYVVRYNGTVVAMTGGMAAATNASNTTLSFDNTHGGNRPYVVGRTILHYYETESLDKVWIGISGVKARTKYQNLLLIPAPFMAEYATEAFKKTNTYQIDYYYRSTAGDLAHSVASLTDPDSKTRFESGEKTWLSAFTMDKAPEFIESDKKYYSMDGIHYYSDPLLTTEVGVFYPYFQFLSYHTQTEYTASQINTYMKNSFKSDSVLREQGAAFIQAQKVSGINALMELAYAAHETGGGVTSIAKNKNNVFGITAYDSSPGESASTFDSVEACILYHADKYLKTGYLDAVTDSRYYGANPGDKSTGINVRYASDPYHGQKVAGWAYRMDKAMGSKDYGKYTIGISGTSIPVYSDTSGTTVLYNMRNNRNKADLSGLPVVVLSQTDDGQYYKVQSDMPINEEGKAYCYAAYSFDHVGYVKTGDVTILDTAVKPLRPAGLTAEMVNTTSIKLSWTLSQYAQSYEIEMSTMQNSGFTVIAQTENTTYTANKLDTGTTYYFRIRACKTTYDQMMYSSYTSVVSNTTKPLKLQGLTAESTGMRSVKLSWAMVNGAEGYLIRRSLTPVGGYSTVAVIDKGSTLTYKDTYLDPDTTYYYCIRGFKTVNGVTVNGAYSDPAEVRAGTIAPIDSVALPKGTNSITLSWKKIGGVSGYVVARYTASSGKYTIIGKTNKSTALTFSDSGLKTGTEYTYKVCAYIVIGGKTYYSDYSKAFSAVAGATAPPATPTLTQEPGYILRIRFPKVSGAAGYQITCSVSADFLPAETTSKTYTGYVKIQVPTFQKKPLVPGAEYFVKIRAYKLDAKGKKIWSNYSGVQSFVVADETPPVVPEEPTVPTDPTVPTETPQIS